LKKKEFKVHSNRVIGGREGEERDLRSESCGKKGRERNPVEPGGESAKKNLARIGPGYSRKGATKTHAQTRGERDVGKRLFVKRAGKIQRRLTKGS